MGKYSGKLAQRYARALLRAVREETAIELLAAQLSGFAETWQQSADLRNALLNPMFSKSDRLRALLSLATDAGLPDVAKRFLQLTFERDRIAALPEIAEAFLALVKKIANVVEVGVTVAREVTMEEARQIEFDLRQHIQGTLEFSWSVDSAIIGGMVVSYSGNVLDGSLQSKLLKMERQLLAA